MDRFFCHDLALPFPTLPPSVVAPPGIDRRPLLPTTKDRSSAAIRSHREHRSNSQRQEYTGVHLTADSDRPLCKPDTAPPTALSC